MILNPWRLLLSAYVAAVVSAPAETPAGSEIVLHTFGGRPKGAYPNAVIRDAAGNFYGTTASGGAANAGVVYKLDAAGRETVLYSFTGRADGLNPDAGVIGDSAGNLYGTTAGGGTSNQGVVYKLDTSGHETVLHSFTGRADGGSPFAGVIRDTAGNLYGTTAFGGTADAGAVYKLDTAGQATVLHSFTRGADGGSPFGGVIRDAAGNLYGTTSIGGAGDLGVVYKLDTTGLETVLYSFTGGADGGYPYAGVIRDAAGNLYGTTNSGGAENWGVVFKLDTTGHETVLYNFTLADGFYSTAGVIADAAGNLYGTTKNGGTTNAGVVYKLDTTGQQTVLYSFTGGVDGGYPLAGIIRDAAGNLYGTTNGGGTAGVGVVYKLDATGHETVLYSFPGVPDGGLPSAGAVIRDSAGNLYGTTIGGGTPNGGVVYKVDSTGHETVLYSFTGAADGGYPWAGVIRDAAGNFYGTTSGGGPANAGVVFKLDTAGHETVLYSFTGGADGGYPYAGVTRDAAGNLYGTTPLGGTADAGVVYKLDTAGHETVLHSFTGGADGGRPYYGSVIRDAAGNLYGTTYIGGASNHGTVYRLDTTGHETVLHSFSGTDGSKPFAGVIRDPSGNLYGTTHHGGTAGNGVVYKLDAAGHETVLYSFTGADGGGPTAGVIRDAVGNLYGTTWYGGTAGSGVVYELDTTGHQTVLYTFTDRADGGFPIAGVIRDAAGNLYGTTLRGGKWHTGVVFKIKP